MFDFCYYIYYRFCDGVLCTFLEILVPEAEPYICKDRDEGYYA